MFLSAFDLFKIGVGPSSSHTMGPMIAARRFAAAHVDGQTRPLRIRVFLHGALAYTGKGHATDLAIMAGLAGLVPESYDATQAKEIVRGVREDKVLAYADGHKRPFDAETDIVFNRTDKLPGHSNGMRFTLLDLSGAEQVTETYYSVGGGFVLTEAELERDKAPAGADCADVPFPFANATEMLEMADASGLTIAEIKRRNESAVLPEPEIDSRLARLWEVMSGSIERGLAHEGTLPGGLKLARRAKALAVDRLSGVSNHPFNAYIDRVAAYAIAVNEENAAGGQVVTAPTNGAAGIIPAVLKFVLDHLQPEDPAQTISDYLLTAAAIGGIIKHNASISGAECGCQAEVGSASAMAAAGLAAISGGTPSQVENAAEIALEHHLGMTCDPVLGLVQVPCIERNAMGSIKAITAASLALRGDGHHFMPLDACIEAVRQTGLDMHERYKETSLGGLAVNSPNC